MRSLSLSLSLSLIVSLFIIHSTVLSPPEGTNNGLVHESIRLLFKLCSLFVQYPPSEARKAEVRCEERSCVAQLCSVGKLVDTLWSMQMLLLAALFGVLFRCPAASSVRTEAIFASSLPSYKFTRTDYCPLSSTNLSTHSYSI